jgi:ribosomal protein S27AE
MTLDYEEFDSCDRICPYCGGRYQVEAEDYSEETRVETCSRCGKKYQAWDVFEVTYHAHRDCELNGETHTPHVSETSYCGKCGMFIAGEDASET